MARLLCESNMNFTASTWKTIESLSWNFSEATQTATSSSVARSSTWTSPGSITYEGVMVRVATRAVSPSGTITITLYNATDAVDERTVTCNVSDLTGGTGLFLGGWVYFKFSSSFTTAAKNYSIGAASSLGEVNLFSTTGSNWSRALVTSTTASAGSADELYVNGQVLSAGSVVTTTLTMNNTASTNFAHLGIGDFGTVTWGTTAATNYVLNLTGLSGFTVPTGLVGFAMTGSATFEMGTPSSRVPVDSTATMTLVSSGSGTGGNSLLIRSYHTFKTGGWDVNRIDTANANFSAGATSITTTTSTGWLNGSLIGIGATDRSGTPAFESKALTANASGTTLSIAAVAAAKSGVAPSKCDLVNLSSNVRIRGTSVTQTFSIYKAAGFGTFQPDNCEFFFMGSGTTNYRGIDIIGANTTSSDVNTFYRCSFRDPVSSGIPFFIYLQAQAENLTVDECVFFGVGRHLFIPSVTLSTGNILIRNSVSIGSNNTITFNDDNIEVNGLVINASTAGLTYSAVACKKPCNNLTISCSGARGLNLTATNLNITNLNINNCAQYGLVFAICSDIMIDGLTLFGSTTGNIFLSSNAYASNIKIKNGSNQAGSAFASAAGIYCFTSCANNFVFENYLSGTVTPFSVGDVQVAAQLAGGSISFVDASLASTTQVSGQSFIGEYPSRISIQKGDGTVGNNTSYYQQSKVTTDAVIFDTTPYSMRVTPISATIPTKVLGARFNVANGTTGSISVKIRKSVIGDGTAYNGSEVQWYLRAAPQMGSAYDSDILMGTTSGAAGSWETLSYTLPTAVADNSAFETYYVLTGTTGWVNIDTYA